MQATNVNVVRLAEAVQTFVEGASRGMARTYDVTRIGLLRQAVSAGPVRPSDLAEALDVNPSTVTRYVQALEEDGLVVVSGDASDRRSCLISATARGQAELARFDKAGFEVFGAVVHDWSGEDLRRFAEFIDRLAQAWTERGPASSRPSRTESGPRWRTAPVGSRR
jgi:DNA-binding MarR family transcriptional regulator